jgi:hypothetical protein
VIAHQARMQRRQTDRYKLLLERICGLRDAELRAHYARWEGEELVRERNKSFCGA